jgi:hypothetical protein
MTKEEKKARDASVRNAVLEVVNKFEIDYDTMMIYILHFYYGFGDKRIRDFHRTLITEREELKRFYSADVGQDEADIHFFAMRQKLKQKGIDVEAIREELMSELMGGGKNGRKKNVRKDNN